MNGIIDDKNEYIPNYDPYINFWKRFILFKIISNFSMAPTNSQSFLFYFILFVPSFTTLNRKNTLFFSQPLITLCSYPRFRILACESVLTVGKSCFPYPLSDFLTLCFIKSFILHDFRMLQTFLHEL